MTNKLEYLVKTFSKTTRKDYENYCINRIWSLLNRTDIKPVTQSYVRFDNGKYALIDLHFPAINYAIEIDETHHLTQQEEDKLRSKLIKEQFKTYKDKDIIIRRIDINQNLENVHKEINNIVSEINTIINNSDINKIKWIEKTEDERIKELQQQGLISVNDDITFKLIEKACNLFFYDNPPIMRGYFPLNKRDDFMMWFPEEATESLGHLNTTNKQGWINKFDDSGEYITEYNINGAPINDKYPDGTPRITFIKTKDPLTNQQRYMFVGIYQLIKKDYKNKEKRTYQRVSTTFNLNDINPYY